MASRLYLGLPSRREGRRDLGYLWPVITLAGLYSYPVKSCRGIQHDSALVTAAGLEHDREWMFATPAGQFITQRDETRLARVEVALRDAILRLSADGAGEVEVPTRLDGPRTSVSVWGDRCVGVDQGPEAAAWISSLLGREARLVRFDPATVRRSDSVWTGDLEALNRFSDGFPLLVVSRASLDDLNSRLPAPVPMNRFRPNLVLDGLPPFGEDELHEIECGGVRLRMVKPCMRCVVTTTDQLRGGRAGDEPVRTLKSYRWNAALRGVAFGQNAVVVEGAGLRLSAGSGAWTPRDRATQARPA
jgi:uncharacterized protein YcbX